MAHRVARRKNSLESVVMCYSLGENQLVSAGLRIRSFLNIEPGWLRFVVANRYFQEDAPDHNLDKRWDVVHGFIADDRIVRLLDALVKGTTTEESVLRTLQASRFKSVQYSLCQWLMTVKGKFGKIQIAKPMESLGRKGTT